MFSSIFFLSCRPSFLPQGSCLLVQEIPQSISPTPFNSHPLRRHKRHQGHFDHSAKPLHPKNIFDIFTLHIFSHTTFLHVFVCVAQSSFRNFQNCKIIIITITFLTLNVILFWAAPSVVATRNQQPPSSPVFCTVFTTPTPTFFFFF